LNKRRIGTQYEELAASYLVAHGYQILEQNYRNSYGEIDIIAMKNQWIVYVEIKYRANNQCGDPLEAVDIRKQKQICRVARVHYARNYAMEEKACRFDVIGIYGDGTIRQVENAFLFQN